MKFRQKIFFITLSIFLIFLNTCCFLLALYTQNKAIKADETLCISEQALIKKAFEFDSHNTNDIGKSIIMESYGSYYIEKNVYLNLSHGSQIIYNSIPEGISPSKAGYSSTQRIDNKRYFIITDLIKDEYLFIYAKEVTYLDNDFKNMSLVFVISSLLASSLLSLILFYVLKKISIPLEKLTSATAQIALGNYSTRIRTFGKDEISILAENINLMAQKVEDQIEHLENSAHNKQLMLDNLAHEMKTPLTSIRGYADYISNAKISDLDRKEASDYIISEADRLEMISEKLLNEAFIRENDIITKPTNLNNLIDKLENTFTYKLKEKGIKLSRNCDNNTVVNCDSILISILLSNLIDNAIKACSENGKISIECEENDTDVIIKIIDNGIGIPDEQIKHIKEPFYRTDSSRSRSDGGTGLGLSLCDKIVKAHTGELNFSSKLNLGTTATIKFTKI